MSMERPARVLILSTEQGKGSGAYRMLEYFLSASPSLARHITVAAPANSSALSLARDLGFGSIAFPSIADRLMANAMAALRLAVTSGHDVVHAWHTRGFEAALALSRRLGIRAAATLHDHPVDSAHSASRLRLMRFAARRMDALVSVGRTLAEAWIPYAGKVPVRIIPNGLPDEPVPVRAPSGRMRLGFAGLYSPDMKGWRHVRDWIHTSRRENWPVTWCLFGLPEDAKKLAAELRLMAGEPPAGFIEIAGFVPTSAIFQSIDLLVHPSDWFDPYPTLLLEAARAGLPVLSSDAGGSGEIVLQGQTGLLYDRRLPEQGLAHLRELVADPTLGARLGSAARKTFCSEHLAGRMSESLAALWSQLIQPPKEPAS